MDRRWAEIDQSKVKLTRDRRHLCESMGVKLPLLPFRNKEEKILFAQLVLDDSLPKDDEQAAIEWCKHADGVNIMFKLPFHMRQQREKAHQTKINKSMMAKSLKGREALDKLNSVIRPEKSTDESQNIAMPASLPNISTDARSDSNAVVVGGVCIGDLPESKSKSRKRGQRGCDKSTTRRPRQCDRCKKWCPEHSLKCTGRGGANKCDLFDLAGTRRCGRCARANAKDKKECKTEGLNAYTCLVATCPLIGIDLDSCQYYTYYNYKLKSRTTSGNSSGN